MTDTTESLETLLPADTETGAAPRRVRQRGEGLSGMVLADLKAIAGQLGIRGTSGMRKGDLVAAISARQTGGASGTTNSGSRPAPTVTTPDASPDRATAPSAAPATETGGTRADADRAQRPERRDTDRPDADRPDTERSAAVNGADDHVAAPAADRDESRDRSAPTVESLQLDLPPISPRDGRDQGEGREDGSRGSRRNRRNRRDRDGGEGASATVEQTDDRGEGDRSAERSGDRADGRDQRAGQNRDGRPEQGRNDQRNQGRDQSRDQGQGRNDQRRAADEDDDGDGRGRRGRRYRERNRRGRDRLAGEGGGAEPEVRDDDVLLPVAGILDVLDSYAFIRTSGYLTGPNDIYVSLSQVRKYGLRRGDAVTGAVRQAREGEQQRQKFNALVRLDSVNGMEPEAAKQRPEFTKLTPLYPNERLRLETESHILTTRVIDLVMPVGKGQRALIVSPPKAGKTSVLQAIANAISTNNPECHLMVVLVDERPEEVTDMQRSVKGEVIASTFDRPPADHTLVAELSIERAKRLVEMGKDVVVLLDSITRLGRAYNLAAPASGRILSGGVDSTALFPPKRFLGAARNIENGGSLTIFASALVETGSAGDTVIFEEFKGTGNAELKLDRRLADKRMFPAIDVDQSSTRKEDLLLSPDELAIVVKLRRVLAALDTQQALEVVLDRLRKTRNNVEFLMQVAKSTPGD
ncbi:transcription termination factor Rho [Nakamurella leprariae]|uniref:Transcription termination factor Rho n=1 Tax=Nakamurella leprariae TaxID=2803911 RepID=A0A938YDI4_9ACTN|nr:transcription termination factor Rho [Nakamurella leprariae]MBM9465753.1 transcription termination factor Rho [Nakamurella leprariae]